MCHLRADELTEGVPHDTTTPQNTKIAMFADDTTLFLGETDRLDVVNETLDHWCKASGAKFNIEKTEIVPIGTENYRTTVVVT
jgi:hypothetical protein